MKINFTKNGVITPGTFQLTRDDIERQAVSDFSKYIRIFQERYKRPITDPLDVDNVAYELWNVEVVYQTINKSNQDEVLGYYDYLQKKDCC
jgi:hypothetical protein